MKKEIITSIFICFILFVSCKSTWLEKTDKTISSIIERSVLVDQFESSKKKDQYMKSELYEYDNFKMLKKELIYDTIMRMNSKIYLKDSLLI